MAKLHNNFHTGDQQLKKWRLWVVFYPGTPCQQKWGEKATFFNFNDNTTKDKDGLIQRIFLANENQIKKAILYDNETGKPIETLK